MDPNQNLPSGDDMLPFQTRDTIHELVLVPPPPAVETLVVGRELPQKQIDRLRTLYTQAVNRGFLGFIGEFSWPRNGTGEVIQRPGPGVISLAQALANLPADAPAGWKLAVIEALARLVDDLHRTGARLNSLPLDAILLEHDTLQLAGIGLPASLTRADAPAAEVPREAVHRCFAAPEIQSLHERRAGRAADIYLLALLAWYTLTRSQPTDLIAAGFNPVSANMGLGPAAIQVLQDALSTEIEARPRSAVELAGQLRQALVRDAARTDWGFACSACSHLGLGGRTNNEDTCGTWMLTERGAGGSSSQAVFVVADGMGGGAFGERASTLAVDAVLREASSWLPQLAGALVASDLYLRAFRQWVLDLNSQVMELSTRLGITGDIGTTLTGVHLIGEQAVLFHVGDSRAYLCRGESLTLLTEDQTLEQELIRQHHPNGNVKLAGRFKNVLLSHLGTSRCDPQVKALQVQPGDRFLLCSDGLIEGLAEADLKELLPAVPTQKLARTLIDRCQANLLRKHRQAQDGSLLRSDNMTAVVFEIVGPDQETTP